MTSHFSHASSYRLQADIFNRFAWLSEVISDRAH